MVSEGLDGRDPVGFPQFARIFERTVRFLRCGVGVAGRAQALSGEEWLKGKLDP